MSDMTRHDWRVLRTVADGNAEWRAGGIWDAKANRHVDTNYILCGLAKRGLITSPWSAGAPKLTPKGKELSGLALGE